MTSSGAGAGVEGWLMSAMTPVNPSVEDVHAAAVAPGTVAPAVPAAAELDN
jgi:hypothetical protein